MKPDRVDNQIRVALQRDCRISNRKLAEQVQISIRASVWLEFKTACGGGAEGPGEQSIHRFAYLSSGSNGQKSLCVAKWQHNDGKLLDLRAEVNL